MTEVRFVDPDTGGEKGQKNEELGYVDPLALASLGRVASFGGKKYASFNYLRGYKWSLSFNAAFRHFRKFLSGEDYDYSTCEVHEVWDNADWSCTDCGSGELHTTHMAWHGLALTSFLLRRIGTDDRAPRSP